jgi:hypothetical protein
MNFNQTVGIYQNNWDHNGLTQILVRALNRNIINVLMSEPHFYRQGAPQEGEREAVVCTSLPYPTSHTHMCTRTQNFPLKYGIDTYF